MEGSRAPAQKMANELAFLVARATPTRYRPEKLKELQNFVADEIELNYDTSPRRPPPPLPTKVRVELEPLLRRIEGKLAELNLRVERRLLADFAKEGLWQCHDSLRPYQNSSSSSSGSAISWPLYVVYKVFDQMTMEDIASSHSYDFIVEDIPEYLLYRDCREAIYKSHRLSDHVGMWHLYRQILRGGYPRACNLVFKNGVVELEAAKALLFHGCFERADPLLCAYLLGGNVRCDDTVVGLQQLEAPFFEKYVVLLLRCIDLFGGRDYTSGVVRWYRSVNPEPSLHLLLAHPSFERFVDHYHLYDGFTVAMKHLADGRPNCPVLDELRKWQRRRATVNVLVDDAWMPKQRSFLFDVKKGCYTFDAPYEVARSKRGGDPYMEMAALITQPIDEPQPLIFQFTGGDDDDDDEEKRSLPLGIFANTDYRLLRWEAVMGHSFL